jgi:hypothetical protein
MSPGSTTTLVLFFRSLKNNDLTHNDQLPYDKVTLTVTQGDIQEVMDALIQLFNSAPNSDGFLVVADDCTDTDSATAALAGLDHSSYAHPSITGVASIVVADKLYKTIMPSIGTAGVAPTATAAGALAVNTHYTNAETAAKAYTIPQAGAGREGDWITVTYIASIGNGNVHSYTQTTDAQYQLGSMVRNQGGSRSGVVDVSVANDDIVNITGDTNGDGGIGTTLRFVNKTGTTSGWSVDAVIQPQGTGAEACGATSATGFAAG